MRKLLKLILGSKLVDDPSSLQHLADASRVSIPLILLTMAFCGVTGSSLAFALPTVFICYFVGAACVKRREPGDEAPP